MIWPVVWLDLSDKRKTAILAISSGVVILFSKGIFSLMYFNFSSAPGSFLIQFAYCGVQHSETTIEFTLILYFNNSTAHSLVNAFLPPFAAAYPDVFPCPVSAVFEPMFTIAPCDNFKKGNA